MSLFGRKKEKEVKEPQQKTEKKTTRKAKGTGTSRAPLGTAHPLTLKAPRITEKATDLSAEGVYVFDVDMRSTKQEVAKAVESVYGVTPRKVNMLQVRGKRVSGRRGLGGRTARGKKAYVFLKEGDSIDSV